MDTKIIKQYREDILCYRLRTARQKKRMRYKDFDKHLIKLHKTERQLNRQIRNLGWEPLCPPVQKGWVRHFVVRDDVARSRHGNFFENILKKINTYDYHWRKDFKRKKKKRGKKIYIVKEQHLLHPHVWQMEKLKFTDAEKQFFSEVWKYDWKGSLVKRFVFNVPWRFVLKIKPNMIDKVRIVDAVLESQCKEIDNYLERNGLRGRQANILNGHFKWREWKEFEKHSEVNQFKNKSLFQILDLIKQ